MTHKWNGEGNVNTRQRILILLLGYLAVAIFLLAFFAANNVNAWLGLPAPLSEVATLALAAVVATPVLLALIGERLTKVKVGEVEIDLAQVKVQVSLALAEELKDVDRLRMCPSATPNIIEKITAAVQQAETTGVVEVDLGNGQTWWSTRLFLLAALAEDYTRVRQILFLENCKGLDRCFVGSASPTATRQVLAATKPALEKAYQQARAQQIPCSDVPAQRVASVATQFPSEFGPSAGEADVKEWVTRQFLESCLKDVNHGLEWPDSTSAGSPPLWLLHSILDRSERFVALVDQDGQLDRVVDRLALAERIAKTTVRQKLTG